MNQKEFYYYVEQHIKDYLPEQEKENVFVYLHPVRKTNDAVRYGLSIRRDGESVSPVIYLEDAWKVYQEGGDKDEIIRNLVEIYRENEVFSNLHLSLDYEEIKDKIVFFVVSKEANRNNLKERVYTDVGQGLVKVYVVQNKLDGQNAVKGNIAITHNLMKSYGYDLDKICEDAERNTPQYFPAVLEPILSAMAGKSRDEFQNPVPDTEGMFILSNPEYYRGAGALFYPDMQKRIAEHFGRNYYVLPSSLHEVLILPEKEGLIPEFLECMVKEINKTKVEREDFLSDKVLYYDREKEQLRIALPEEPQRNRESGDTREAR